MNSLELNKIRIITQRRNRKRYYKLFSKNKGMHIGKTISLILEKKGFNNYGQIIDDCPENMMLSDFLFKLLS